MTPLKKVREVLEYISTYRDRCTNMNTLREYGDLTKEALTELNTFMELYQNKMMKQMGLLNVLCECHVYAPDEEREMIMSAVLDNLPEGWRVKRIIHRLELLPPELETQAAINVIKEQS